MAADPSNRFKTHKCQVYRQREWTGKVERESNRSGRTRNSAEQREKESTDISSVVGGQGEEREHTVPLDEENERTF